MNGLCIIPEGTDIGYRGQGEVYKVSNIRNLDKYRTYSENMDLGIVYISTKYGVVYADEFVEFSRKKIYKYTLPERKLWSRLVAEQVFRTCLNHSVSTVHLMIEYRSVYSELIVSMRRLGIQVITPFVKER